MGRIASTENVTLCRSCVSSARRAGENAICPVHAQPSAEIVRGQESKRGVVATCPREFQHRIRAPQDRIHLWIWQKRWSVKTQSYALECGGNPLAKSRAIALGTLLDIFSGNLFRIHRLVASRESTGRFRQWLLRVTWIYLGTFLLFWDSRWKNDQCNDWWT